MKCNNYFRLNLSKVTYLPYARHAGQEGALGSSLSPWVERTISPVFPSNYQSPYIPEKEQIGRVLYPATIEMNRLLYGLGRISG